MKKYLYLCSIMMLFLGIIISHNVLADGIGMSTDTGMITGSLSSPYSELGGVDISLRDSSGNVIDRVKSDDEGKYVFENVPDGTGYSVSGSDYYIISSEPQSIDNIAVSAGEITVAEQQLSFITMGGPGLQALLDPVIRIRPAWGYAGDEAEVDIYTDNIEGMYMEGNEKLVGFRLRIVYDNKLLTPISIENGMILGNDELSYSVSSDSACITAEWMSDEPADSDDVLFTIRFRINTEAADESLANIHIDEENSVMIFESLEERAVITGDADVVIKALNEVIEISTLEELEAFRDDVNGGNTYEGKTVELTADIDMSEKYGEGKEIWTPIGIVSEFDETFVGQFDGTFDGNGHTITINYVYADYDSVCGLFAFCGENSHIIRLTLDGIVKIGFPTDDVWAQPPFHVGGIAGCSFGKISDCHNKAEIIGLGNGAYTAGICGLLGGTIENCINTGKIDGGHVSEAISTSSGGGISGCYYLDGTAEYGTDAKVITAEQFASGEVCYLLNEGRSDGAWYQNIGSDAFPVLDSTHSAVYFDGERYYNKINAEISTYMLSNEDYGNPLIFTTYKELEAYIDQNDLGEYNSNRLLEMYPREFFDYKFLYVRYADGGSGSNLYDVQTSENENDIEIVITKTQEGMTDDYMEYCLYAELDKSLLGKNINVVSENIASNYNYYIGRVQTQNEFIPEDKLKLDYTIVDSNDELNSAWNGDANLKTAYGTEFFRNKSLLIVSWDQENSERNYEVSSVVLSDNGSEVTLSYFVPDGASAVGTESCSAVIAIPKTYSDTRVTITAAGDEKEYPYEITSIRLTDTAGEVIAGPNIGQSFIVETGISKLRERNEQDYLFVVVYDEDGSLMNIDYVKANFTVGGEYVFEFNVPPQNKKIGYVKAFVWNTFSSMEPLAEAEIYVPVVSE